MIAPEIIIEKLQAALPGAQIDLQDLTGTQDHYKATIIAPQFIGKARLARHRLVYGALEEEMKGPIHALTLEVYTPEEWEARA